MQAFPTDVSREDMAAYFSLSRLDLAEVGRMRGDGNRLGFALGLGAVRLLGFLPQDLSELPPAPVAFVARQLGVPPKLSGYGRRSQTRTVHLQRIAEHLGMRRAQRNDLIALQNWLVEQAKAHARPTALLSWATEHLQRQRVLRPGVTVLERMVVKARRQAEDEAYVALASIIEPNRALLEGLLETDGTLGQTTRLAWLRQRERTNSARAIKVMLDKHAWLEQAGVASWDVRSVHPNRLRYLARLGDTANPQMMRRMPPRRRYPTLVAYLRQALVNITDELIDMFDRCLADLQGRARLEMKARRREADRARDEIVAAFSKMAAVLMDDAIADADVRRRIFQLIPRQRMHNLHEACAGPARALDNDGFDFLKSRYAYIRQFSQRLLAQLDVSADEDTSVLGAVKALRDAEDDRGRLADDIPVDFIPRRWKRFVITAAGIDRRYYELCALWHLRGALRNGKAWITHSRRFASASSYVMPASEWVRIRGEVVSEPGVPPSASRALEAKAKSLQTLEEQAQAAAPAGAFRVEDGRIVVPPTLGTDRAESLVELEQIVDSQLPKVELCDLLAEVERWTRFSRHLQHATRTGSSTWSCAPTGSRGDSGAGVQHRIHANGRHREHVVRTAGLGEHMAPHGRGT